MSVNEDGKGSEAGLKEELSVVESDNSAHGLETPATALKGDKQGGFLDLHQVHQNATNKDHYSHGKKLGFFSAHPSMNSIAVQSSSEKLQLRVPRLSAKRPSLRSKCRTRTSRL